MTRDVRKAPQGVVLATRHRGGCNAPRPVSSSRARLLRWLVGGLVGSRRSAWSTRLEAISRRRIPRWKGFQHFGCWCRLFLVEG